MTTEVPEPGKAWLKAGEMVLPLRGVPYTFPSCTFKKVTPEEWEALLLAALNEDSPESSD